MKTPIPQTNTLNPPKNIDETKDDYLLEFNVPGRNKEDFKITIDKIS